MTDLQKSPTERVRIELQSFKGKSYLNVRVWVDKADGTMAPTQKGITLDPDLARRMAKAVLMELGEE